MIFLFHPEAERELMEAIEHYESCQSGLGLDFSLGVQAAIETVCEFPEAWPLFQGVLRRRLVNRFPYGIIYYPENGKIQILAVMHLHREPGYWKGRLL